jgi:hypothetical protein
MESLMNIFVGQGWTGGEIQGVLGRDGVIVRGIFAVVHTSPILSQLTLLPHRYRIVYCFCKQVLQL